MDSRKSLHPFLQQMYVFTLTSSERWPISKMKWAASVGERFQDAGPVVDLRAWRRVSRMIQFREQERSLGIAREKQRTLVEEWRSYRQTEVSRLSAGSLDNIPLRPLTCNGVLSAKALIPLLAGAAEVSIPTLLRSLCRPHKELHF